MEKNSEIVERLERAWKLIVEQQLSHAQAIAKEEGPGIGIFRMMSKTLSREGKDYNCQYYYAERGSMPWNALFEHSPLKDALLKAYDGEKHFLVTVSVSVSPTDDTVDTTQNIRLFEFDTLKEVSIE